MLLPTIVSRCHRVELVPAAPGVIEEALVQRWEVDPAKARTLSRLCRGCIGWAISAALDESVLEERSEKLAELRGLGTSDMAQRFDLANRLAAGLSKRRDSVEDTLTLWLEWWRDLLLVKAGCSQFVTNVDEEAFLQDQAAKYELAEVRDCIEAIRAAMRQLQQNANPRLVLEVLMLRVPRPDRENKALQRQGQSG
jgi:DNA polymerase-3 subunit delta'